MERKRIAGVGKTREGGYGAAAYLGLLLAVCCWGSAVWSVINRFLSPAVLAAQGSEVQHMYSLLTGVFSRVVFQGGALALFVLAGKKTTSFPNKIAFWVGAAAEGVALLTFGLSYLPVSAYAGLTLDVCGQTLAGGMLTGMLLLLAANRENGDFGRYFCYLAAGLTVAALAALGVYFVEMCRTLQMPYGILSRRCRKAADIRWFLTLTRDVLAGGAFLLLRETKPFLSYPHGDEESPLFTQKTDAEDTANLPKIDDEELDELPQEHGDDDFDKNPSESTEKSEEEQA